MEPLSHLVLLEPLSHQSTDGSVVPPTVMGEHGHRLQRPERSIDVDVMPTPTPDWPVLEKTTTIVVIVDL